MSKTPKAQSKPAASSKPSAAPAVSQPAKGNSGSETGNTASDYDLPSGAEIAALLNTSTEPAGSESDEADAAEPLADTDAEDSPATPEAEAPAANAEAEAETEAETDSDDPAAESEDSAEQETQTEADPAAESADSAEEPKTGFQKRIDELTAARKSAETEAATLREQLAAATHKAPDPLNPFALVDTEADLETAVEREEQFMEWIMGNESNPEGADLPDGKGGTVHFEPEQLRQMKVNTYRVLRGADKRREFLREKATRENAAVESYPWLRSTKEGPGAEVQKLIEARPYLRQSPDYKLLAADAVIGAKLRAAGLKLDEKGLAALLKGKPLAATAPKAAGPAGALALATARTLPAAPIRRAGPTPGRPGTLPARISGREAAERNAGKALQASGGDLDSVSTSIAAKLRW